jgi:hypothetical protein
MIILANLFTLAAIHNYPGALAIDRLVQQHIGLQISLLDANIHLIPRPIFVHMDVLTATSGVSRFLQTRLLFRKSLTYDIPQLESLYLNCSPEQWEAFMNTLAGHGTERINPNWVNIGKDLIFYSKDENVTNYDSYDWLITEDLK